MQTETDRSKMDKNFFKDNAYLIIILLLLVSMYLTNLGIKRAIDGTLMFSAEQSARALNNALESFRDLYSAEVIKKLDGSQFKITHNYKDDDMAIPLPASMTIELGKIIGTKGSGSSAHLYSPYPFPWRSREGGLRDDFQKEAWQFLSDNPDSDFYKIEYIDNETPVLRYARADKMRTSCVQCHNTHPKTPYNKWKVGDLRGILEIRQPLAPIMSAGKKELINIEMIQMVSTALGVLGIFLIVSSFRERLRKQQILQNKLETKNSELEQFSYRTSHDLKAPLTSSKRLSEFVVKDIDSGNLDEAKKNIDRIYKQMVSLEDLVSDILSLSKADLLEFEYQPIDFHEILAKIKNKNFWTESESEFDLREIINIEKEFVGYKTRIAQVLENLISNSIKYRDKNKEYSYVNVNITSTEQRLKIFISDNGLGIPDEYQKDIFNMFKRFHTGAASGSGLGLSIVKKHIDHMNGKIEVTSSMGETCFIIEIPNGGRE